MAPDQFARDIVVIGGSAGSLSGLMRLLRLLPDDLPAAVFVVIHRRASDRNTLAELVAKKTALPVVAPGRAGRLRHGHVYVGPPGRHLLVARGLVQVAPGSKDVLFQPSIDALFRSAAVAYGRRVAGVVLSGVLNDGTDGLSEIKRRGGMAIVQDPREAEFAAMPQSAIYNVAVDHCLPVEGIAEKLVEMAAPAPRSRL